MHYDPDKKYNLYELIQKADGGDIEAMGTLVAVLAVEGYVEKEPDGDIARRYVSYLQQLADAGEAEAYIMLGDAYKDGKGVQQNRTEAVRLYEKAVENGILFGNECIGMLYYDDCNYERAFEYLTKDDGSKSPCSYYALGEMFRQGLYVTQNDKKACEYYAEIAEGDISYVEMDDYYWRACYRLGVARHYGRGTERDLYSASELISTAKQLYEERDENSDSATDITRDELFQEWIQVSRDAGIF